MAAVGEGFETGFAFADVLALRVVGRVGAAEVGVLGGDPVVRGFHGGDGGGGAELVFVRFVDLVGERLDGEGGFGDDGGFGARGGVEGEEFVIEAREFGAFGCEVGLGYVVGVLRGVECVSLVLSGIVWERGRTLTWVCSVCKASISSA